ncbi:uncharacterized protein BKA55DRAFT_559475 [Fusarium redolens]|uniref:Uncharacterized protein n=1 Tax=Fusarium redolens TaxID=48865 RepID=A0A9P9HZY9_FUSRE|nr:uncharacterized protein BKA55DRAFT_559475 [Fusarium redolens]KAH7265749.1 hypothetical protein BKA55DRAFT_559475 [Fusarium redolens]
MASNLFFVYILCILLAGFSSFVRAQFLLKYPSSIADSNVEKHIDLTSCMYVITQAFAGWQTRYVTVPANNHIRWGQKKCVLQINNNNPHAFVVKGGDLARGLVQLTVVAGSSSPFGSSAMWLGAFPASPVLTIAHSNRFGGDVGNPVTRRDAVPFPELDPSTTHANPATNDFAAYLAGIDFEDLRNNSTASAASDPTGGEENASAVRRRRSDEPHQLVKRAYRTAHCAGEKDVLNDKIKQCDCKDGTRDIGRFEVTCHGERSMHHGWTLDKMRNTVGSLRGRIEHLLTTRWDRRLFSVYGQKHPGGVLLTPTATRSRPDHNDARCCELLLNQVAGEMGFAPASCTCEPVTVNKAWHMMVTDTLNYPIAG